MNHTDPMIAGIDRLMALWEREQASTRARFREERQGKSAEERAERGLALLNLEVGETAAAAGGRLMLWLEVSSEAELDAFRGRNGSPVILWWDDPGQEDAVEAIVARRKRDRIAVVVDEVDDRLLEGRFHLDVEAPETTFLRGMKALMRFRGASKSDLLWALRGVLFGELEPAEPVSETWTPLDEGLNQGQRRAVHLALGSRDLALVHGPPGTGKTRTLVEVIRQHARRGQRVLATAASNAAVDNLAEKLVESGLDVVRLGHPARLDPKVESRGLDAILESTKDYRIAQKWMSEAQALRRTIQARSARGTMSRSERREAYREVRRLMGDARGHLRRMQGAIIDRAQVVCATATGADTTLLDEMDFDVVVIDEATQAPDPIALVAMCRAPKVIMAGDPHQLPPTVIDLEAAREGLGTTFFERLAGEAVMLTEQYRMHEAIMSFSSAAHYGGELTAHQSVVAHRLFELDGVEADVLRPEPVMFIDTAGKGWSEESGGDDPSLFNPGQAERVVREARRLLGRGLSPDELAIITPYAAQVRRLRELLAVEGLEIGTVDSFQGREKEAVIVDLVRSNDRGEIGFLSDTRRMNVALTRARRQLLVVGDSATIGGHEYYSAFLESVENLGGWISAWSDEAEPF